MNDFALKINKLRSKLRGEAIKARSNAKQAKKLNNEKEHVAWRGYATAMDDAANLISTTIE